MIITRKQTKRKNYLCAFYDKTCNVSVHTQVLTTAVLSVIIIIMKRKYEIAVVSKNGYARTVRMFAPKTADRAIILHDGQNIFYDSDATFGKSWRALETLKSLNIKNTAIIGVDSTATRNDDYLPFPAEAGFAAPCGGKADAYADYLENGLLPYLETRFGFKAYAMAGSSAGALATLCFAARNVEKFKAYGLYSTPLFVSQSAFDDFLNSADFPSDCIYELYVGGNERADDAEEIADSASAMYVADAYKLTASLGKRGAANLRLTVKGDGIHDETCWRAPFARLLSAFSELNI